MECWPVAGVAPTAPQRKEGVATTPFCLPVLLISSSPESKVNPKMTMLVHLPVFDTIAKISKQWNLSSLSSWSRLEARPTLWPLRWTEVEDPIHGTKSGTLKCKSNICAKLKLQMRPK